jgi:hypothetical protein
MSSSPNEEVKNNNRAGNRKRCLLQGRVAFNFKGSTFDCTVRNISDTGARLVFPDTVVLPREFSLTIESQSMTSNVRLMWSTGKEAGVRFIQNG